MTPIGIITGTGTYALPWLDGAEPVQVETPYGSVGAARGRLGHVDVVHISRHGASHSRLSNHVAHRANLAALARVGARAVVATTICGAVDPSVALGSLVVFDDLYFPSNRLADGSLCTFHLELGKTGQGHWIFEQPYAEPLREALLAGAAEAGFRARDGGVYGHSDGPRFESPAEVAALVRSGVTAVSQTGGPETVLAGELELPYALLGFAVNYANGVAEPTPTATLARLLEESRDVFAEVLAVALPRLGAAELAPSGTVYRFDD